MNIKGHLADQKFQIAIIEVCEVCVVKKDLLATEDTMVTSMTTYGRGTY